MRLTFDVHVCSAGADSYGVQGMMRVKDIVFERFLPGYQPRRQMNADDGVRVDLAVLDTLSECSSFIMSTFN